MEFDPMEYRVLRVRKGMTIKALAAEIDYSPLWLSLCETGRGVPSRRMLKSWNKALEVFKS